MIRPNLISIASLIFLAYISHSIYTLYSLFFPPTCKKIGNCLEPALYDPTDGYPKFQLRLYASLSKSPQNLGRLIETVEEFDISAEYEKVLELALPGQTRKNGSLHIHSFLLPIEYESESPFQAPWHMLQSAEMTTFMVPQANTFQLMGGAEENSSTDDINRQSSDSLRSSKTPVSHLKSVLPLGAVDYPKSFDWDIIPGELIPLLRLEEGSRKYLPIFYLNELNFRVKDFAEIKPEAPSMNLTLKYSPLSIGKLRLLITAVHSLSQLKALGFSEKDVDEVKGIFTDTNFYFLAITFFVAAVHLLLDFLAFKNDIQFWRGRKTMVGLSSRTLIWRCFSYTVIFFYLLDEETSLLVLIPAGVGTLIEFWKLKKAFKVTISWSGWMPKFNVGDQSDAEIETESFDSQGMKYLAFVLIPLCICGAIYSLLYLPHKSWYSWFIQSMGHGVYAFGFLFMLPQLFVNYKLKSVAHLPWRAFMYKAFNTFIDDLFAFIISMPTAHRVACFRDDIVFLVYLYQRYLYPVDRKRVNEFGETFDEEPTASSPKKESKKTK